MKQLSKTEWNEVTIPIQLCHIEMPASDFFETHSIDSFKYIENGLGELTAAVIQINNTIFWIRGPSGIGEHHFTLFEVRSFEPDTKVAFDHLCEEFNFREGDFVSISESLGPAKWCLSRYDDNGNDIEMFRFHEESMANAVLKIYENQGHKQAYFVKET